MVTEYTHGGHAVLLCKVCECVMAAVMVVVSRKCLRLSRYALCGMQKHMPLKHSTLPTANGSQLWASTLSQNW